MRRGDVSTREDSKKRTESRPSEWTKGGHKDGKRAGKLEKNERDGEEN